MATALRTDQAEEDLDKILLELGRQSVAAGHRLVQLIAQKSQRYADRPEVGILRDDLLPSLRCFMIWSYLVFYRSIPDGIVLLRVIHGSRDIGPSDFNQSEP